MATMVCSSRIEVSVEDGIIRDVKFSGGCNGNLQGVAKLAKDRPVKEVINASGAGDAFMGAIAYGYLTDMDTDSTLNYALAAGIAAISDPNTINPRMSVEMIEKIITERG